MVIVHQPTKTPPIGFDAQPKHQKQKYGWLHCQRHTSWGNFRVFTFSSSNMHKDLHRASQLQGSPSVCRAVAGKHCIVCFAYHRCPKVATFLFNECRTFYKQKWTLCLCSTSLTTRMAFNQNSEEKEIEPMSPFIANQLSHGINVCDIVCV